MLSKHYFNGKPWSTDLENIYLIFWRTFRPWKCLINLPRRGYKIQIHSPTIFLWPLLAPHLCITASYFVRIICKYDGYMTLHYIRQGPMSFLSIAYLYCCHGHGDDKGKLTLHSVPKSQPRQRVVTM